MDVLDAGAGARDELTAAAVHAVLGSVAAVPGARRWWIESIPRGVELHGEVGLTQDVIGTRETRVAAGAGLFAAHLAVAALGIRPVTTLLPRPGRPRLLAVLRHGAEQPPTPAERSLHAALRGTVGPVPAEPQALRAFLRRAADAEGVWLHSPAGTGGRAALRAVLRGCVEVPADGLLVLLATPHDLPQCQLRAGRALERLLLTAAVLGHTGTVLAGPGRLDSSRRALRAAELDPRVAPQVLVSIRPRPRRSAAQTTVRP
jgi:hypothetical protein